MSADFDSSMRRAASERLAHRPYLAYRFLRHAAKLAATHAPELYLTALHQALDICGEYFTKDADETLETARLLVELSQRSDARALSVLGAGLSLRSRRSFASRELDLAWKEAREAEACLLEATKHCPFDSDAWGTLGGLYKRMASWAKLAQDAAASASFARQMLDAYRTGMRQGPDPYPTLNYLEQRAVLEPNQPLVRGQERELLERALDVRRNQFARGEDAPWAAFDLARGQHYLNPNVPRFLNDLNIAIEDARRVARRASDRWMVDTAVTSLRDLFEANVPLEGLQEALLLARAAVVDDGWVAGNWGPLGRPEDFLAAELRAARAQLTELEQQGSVANEKLLGYVRQAEQRWSEADEERFNREAEKELAQFKLDLESPVKKQIRVLWKVFGDDAIQWLVAGGVGAVAPAAGVAVPLIVKYVQHLTKPS